MVPSSFHGQDVGILVVSLASDDLIVQSSQQEHAQHMKKSLTEHISLLAELYYAMIEVYVFP